MVTKEDKQKLYKLLIISVILILVMGFIAYKTDKSSNILSFLGLYPFPSLMSILVGMSANIVFGMIDNGGLFFGMDALDPFLPEGELTRAGLGNTFSDFLGAFLGTFAGVAIKNLSNINDTPLWSDAIGIVIGCLIGLYVPKTITGKK